MSADVSVANTVLCFNPSSDSADISQKVFCPTLLLKALCQTGLQDRDVGPCKATGAKHLHVRPTACRPKVLELMQEGHVMIMYTQGETAQMYRRLQPMLL